jgi:uncharacterized hydrophobic protein (TIGR00271 family)
VRLLADDDACTHLTVHDDARPGGGALISADVTPEGADDVLVALQSIGAGKDLHVTLQRVELTLSQNAERAEALTPGDPNQAITWATVERDLERESVLSASFLALMLCASLIAAAGVMTDSAVLIVGAMVVGPEYGPIAALSYGLARRQRGLAIRSAQTLALGFAIAIVAAAATAFAVRLLGALPDAFTDGANTLTSFIEQPDGWALFVAAIAGVAGMLSLEQARAGTLVGVAISVTTIPAAADIGASFAAGRYSGSGRAALQLLANLVVMVAASVAMLALQRRWPRLRAAMNDPGDAVEVSEPRGR